MRKGVKGRRSGDTLGAGDVFVLLAIGAAIALMLVNGLLADRPHRGGTMETVEPKGGEL